MSLGESSFATLLQLGREVICADLHVTTHVEAMGGCTVRGDPRIQVHRFASGVSH